MTVRASAADWSISGRAAPRRRQAENGGVEADAGQHHAVGIGAERADAGLFGEAAQLRHVVEHERAARAARRMAHQRRADIRRCVGDDGQVDIFRLIFEADRAGEIPRAQMREHGLAERRFRAAQADAGGVEEASGVEAAFGRQEHRRGRSDDEFDQEGTRAL